MQSEIINTLPDQADYVIGFADMGDLVKDHYPCRYAVEIGKRLDGAIIDGIENGPTAVYFSHKMAATRAGLGWIVCPLGKTSNKRKKK